MKVDILVPFKNSFPLKIIAYVMKYDEGIYESFFVSWCIQYGILNLFLFHGVFNMVCNHGKLHLEMAIGHGSPCIHMKGAAHVDPFPNAHTACMLCASLSYFHMRDN